MGLVKVAAELDMTKEGVENKVGEFEKLVSEFLSGYATGFLRWMGLCHLRECASLVPAF